MVKTHGPRSCKPPRKLLAGQDDQSERNEDPKMLQPVVSAVEARGHSGNGLEQPLGWLKTFFLNMVDKIYIF